MKIWQVSYRLPSLEEEEMRIEVTGRGRGDEDGLLEVEGERSGSSKERSEREGEKQLLMKF